MHLRKTTAGSTSHGYTWHAPGDVVEVADHHAAELLRIRDAGFAVVEAPPVVEASDEDQDVDETGDEDAEAPEVPPTPADGDEVIEPDEGGDLTEPAPPAAAPVTEPAPRRARKTNP